VSLKRSELFARWGDLQLAQDENAEAPDWADRERALGLARDAYFDAVRFGAVEDDGNPPTVALSVGPRATGRTMPTVSSAPYHDALTSL
jgi:hypothetical protein